MRPIRRPLALIGFAFFITGSIVLSMPGEYTAILLALFVLSTFIHHKIKGKYTNHLLLVLTVAAISTAYTFTYNHFYENSIDKISTEKQNYTGYVTSVTNNENTGYNVTLVDEKGREMHGVSIYYGADFNVGDVIDIEGKFSRNKNNQYIFSNYSKGIKGKITADKIVLSDAEINTVKYKALTFRKALLKSAEEIYQSDYLALVSSMGYSDKHLVSDSLNKSFKSAGLSHALVVSGFHVGIIVYAITLLLKYFPFNKKAKNIITAVFVIAFMYLIGLTPSVIRAGMLAAVILVCANFRIEQDSLTTLAVIGLFGIIQNPYITRDIGVMLSYAAASGIVVTNEYCKRKGIDGVKLTFTCSSMAVLFTLPILALAGMRVTVLSPVIYFILAIPVSVICVLSVVTPIINLVPFLSAINSVLVIANTYIMTTVIAAIKLIDRYFNFAFVNLSSPVFLFVTLAAIIAAIVAYLHTDDKMVMKIFVIAVSILAFICYNLLNYNTVTVTAFDSGREASFHISSKGKEYLVLSEWMTQEDAKQQLVSANGNRYENIYFCPKEFKYYTDFNDISKEYTEVSQSGEYSNGVFLLKSDVSGNKKLFTISVAECDIQFAHGKVTNQDAEYYFLGNDKPKFVTADEIYIFGNIPSWMEVDDITQISNDLTIRINMKTGKYKTVKDVFNFGY